MTRDEILDAQEKAFAAGLESLIIPQSEKWHFTGYGRAWSEEKATGIARFFQIMREPAGYGAYYAAGVVCLALYAIFILLVVAHRG